MASKMTIVIVLVGLVLFSGLGWLLVIAYAARKAAKAYAEPVNDTKLKSEEDDLLKRVQEQADKDLQEVKNASGEDLRKLGVRRLFRVVK